VHEEYAVSSATVLPFHPNVFLSPPQTATGKARPSAEKKEFHATAKARAFHDVTDEN
jgi:hypothetical protein